MATALELSSQGKLIKLTGQIRPNEQEFRHVFLAPRCREWLESVLPTLASVLDLEHTPAEQLAALLADFCSGEELAYYTTFHELRPVGHGVWELKTPDLRLFGWFASKDCFIAVHCETKARILELGLAGSGFVETVRHFRNALELDEPKFVPGDNQHHVISNSG